jgi:hypothetical protein
VFAFRVDVERKKVQKNGDLLSFSPFTGAWVVVAAAP